MYKIIGADQKEYGPVSAELIRQWIVEGRANAQTQARLEGETEWKPLSSFQDFEAALRSVPPPGAPFAGTAAGPVPVEVILGREYELDIGSCIARAWDLVRQNFWPVVGVSLLIMIITAAINQVVSLASGPAFRTIILEHRVSPGIISVIVATSLLSSPIYTLLTAGLFKYYLKLIRAEGPTLGCFCGVQPAGWSTGAAGPGQWVAGFARLHPVHYSRHLPDGVMGVFPAAGDRSQAALLGRHGTEPKSREPPLVHYICICAGDRVACRVRCIALLRGAFCDDADCFDGAAVCL